MYFYCWHCVGLLEQRHSVAKIDGVPRCMCPDCRTDCKPVSCLVCFDSGEVSALGEGIACHRGCGAEIRRGNEVVNEAMMRAATVALFTDRKMQQYGDSSRIPLDTESGTAYSLEESATRTGERDEED